MRTKTLAAAIIGIGCVAASAAAGYLALRQNQADTRLDAQAAAKPADPAQPPAPADVAAATAPQAAPTVPDPPPASTSAKPPTRLASKPLELPKKPSAGVPTTPVPAPQPEPASMTTPDSASVRPVATSTDTPTPIVIAPLPAGTPVDPPPSTPTSAPVPEYLELTIAAQSVIGIRLDTSISSETARVEDRVTAHVTRDVTVSGHVAIPAGARLDGSVTTVEKGGKFKDQAKLVVKFTTLYLADGTRVALQTEPISRGDDSASGAAVSKVGGGAVVGTILGAILGGKKGAAVGAAAGGGAGAAAVANGKSNEATLGAGMNLTVQLSAPATITVQKT